MVGIVMREASAGSAAAAEAGPEACELGKRARDPGSSAGWTGGPWSYSRDPWMCVRLWTWRVPCVCYLWTSISTSLRGGRGFSCLCLCFMWVLCTCRRQTLSGAACVTDCQCFVSVCVCVSLGYVLQAGPAKEEAAAASPSLGKDPRSLDARLGPSGHAGAVLWQSSWRRWPNFTARNKSQ